jgi:sulfite reductase (NADPH) flavoprotein alpha-component
MASLPQLPPTAPFRPEEIAALNGVFAKTTPEQRTWLSGFLAGYQAATGAAGIAPAAATAPAKKVPLLILFATESGNAETLAATVRKAAQKMGFAPRVADVATITVAEAAKAENLLMIASTWGEGDPPQRAIDFHQALMAPDAPRFDKTRFSVLALGDRAYVNFCSTGRDFDARIAALGGTRLAPVVECDVDYDAPATAWIKSSLDLLKQETDGAVIHVDFARAAPASLDDDDDAEPAYTRNHPFEAEIRELINLNGSGSSSETFHIELSLEGSGLAHEPGDALGIVPQNDPVLVDEILGVTGLAGNAEMRTALIEAQDITTLTRPQIEAYAKLTDSSTLNALLADADALKAWLPGRHVIDLLETAPLKLDAGQLAGLLRSLPGRLYSIASSRLYAEEEAHLLVSAVRYETHGRTRAGVASVDLAERRKAGETLKVYLKPNAHFRLPADPDRAVIMIGPGTGVAPFRAFMQQREASGATGRNWLFFGNRHFTNDFLYQLEWQDWKASGLLTRIDTAFSRDQREKIYVQHRIWEQRTELFRWIEDGAALYVCGDANAMAKDVHTALIRAIADQSGGDEVAATAKLDSLRRDNRYLRDVY